MRSDKEHHPQRYILHQAKLLSPDDWHPQIVRVKHSHCHPRHREMRDDCIERELGPEVVQGVHERWDHWESRSCRVLSGPMHRLRQVRGGKPQRRDSAWRVPASVSALLSRRSDGFLSDKKPISFESSHFGQAGEIIEAGTMEFGSVITSCIVTAGGIG
jgi:hypothetical protein